MNMIDMDSAENKDGLAQFNFEENIMSVSSIGASLIASAQNVASGGAQTSSVASAAQEAEESPTQTAQEAKHGDPVAKKKLAKLQAQQQQQAAEEQPSDPNKGTLVDHVA